MQQELIRGERHRPWQEALIAFAILLLTLPFVYTLSKNGFDSHHTGLMYKGALDVASGKALFRETFTQYGALTTYIQALFLLIFGKRVTSILLATALFYALDFLLLYRISRRFLCRTLSLVGTGITVFLAPFYFEIGFSTRGPAYLPLPFFSCHWICCCLALKKADVPLCCSLRSRAFLPRLPSGAVSP